MMEVEFKDNEAVVSLPWPPPPEKDELKELGARWQSEGKVWRVPLSLSVIRWFHSHGVEVPEEITGKIEENLVASRAADADVDLPVPEGLEYRPFQKAGVAWALGHEGALIGDEMGLGKAAPVSEPVLTPTGWRVIGDLRVGDMVIGADGYPTRVLGVYPQKDRRVVRITMSDGTWTRCSWDHLWLVQPVDSSDADWLTMTTAEIMAAGLADSNGDRWRIPMVKPVQHPTNKHPVDPYLLGLLLGCSIIRRDLQSFFDEDGIAILTSHIAIPRGSAITDTARYLLRSLRGLFLYPRTHLKALKALRALRALRLLNTLRTLNVLEVFEVLRILTIGGLSDPMEALNALEVLNTLKALDPMEALQALKLLEASETLKNIYSLKVSDPLDILKTLETLKTLEKLKLSEFFENFELFLEAPEPTDDEQLRKQLELCRTYKIFGSRIAAEWLVESVESRHVLLQGFLDTGGEVLDGGIVEFEASSPELLDSISQIVESLGGTAKREYLNGRQLVSIMLPEGFTPFRFSRKAAAYAASTKYPPTRIIASITPEPDEDSVCIRVEADDHLYVTRHHIVTHNTIQALGVVNADSSIRSVLVVSPLSVALNWKVEAEKWLTKEMSIGVASSKELPDTDIVIAHWGIISKHAEALRERKWDLVVLDEAHYAKNPKAGRTKALFGDRFKKLAPLAAGRRLALSGTPIPNRPIEIYPVLKWLAPQEFPSWMQFALRYCDGHNNAYGFDSSGASHLDELQERLRSAVMVRRLKKDVLTELPDKTRQVITISADTADLKRALASEKTKKAETDEALVKALAKVELAKAGDEEEYKEAVNALREAQGVAFTEMSRVRHETAVAKVPQVLSHLKDVLADEGQKVVLFAHHRDVIGLLREGLETSSGEWQGVKTVSIMGGDSMESRQEAVTSFQSDPSISVFIGSIGAAREGITLTAADIAVFAEIDWVPGNLSQAESRLHRIGQRNAVTIQHILLDRSLDATMIQKIISKQEVLDDALDKEAKDLPNWEFDDGAKVVLPLGPGDSSTGGSSEKATEPATRSTSREQIAKRAEVITTDEIEEIHTALRTLSFLDPDHARGLNDVGFSRIDGALGHDLAERGSLSPKQAVLGSRLIVKYHRQVGEEIAGLWRMLGERSGEASAEKGQSCELPSLQAESKPRGRGLW